MHSLHSVYFLVSTTYIRYTVHFLQCSIKQLFLFVHDFSCSCSCSGSWCIYTEYRNSKSQTSPLTWISTLFSLQMECFFPPGYTFYTYTKTCNIPSTTLHYIHSLPLFISHPCYVMWCDAMLCYWRVVSWRACDVFNVINNMFLALFSFPFWHPLQLFQHHNIT